MDWTQLAIAAGATLAALLAGAGKFMSGLAELLHCLSKKASKVQRGWTRLRSKKIQRVSIFETAIPKKARELTKVVTLPRHTPLRKILSGTICSNMITRAA